MVIPEKRSFLVLVVADIGLRGRVLELEFIGSEVLGARRDFGPVDHLFLVSVRLFGVKLLLGDTLSLGLGVNGVAYSVQTTIAHDDGTFVFNFNVFFLKGFIFEILEVACIVVGKNLDY